jgi:hypothetical protein
MRIEFVQCFLFSKVLSCRTVLTFIMRLFTDRRHAFSLSLPLSTLVTIDTT